MIESFEAIYYPTPTPSSWESLTLLALVFDRIHFPGVYMPTSGVDIEGTKKEIERIAALGKMDVDTAILINSMQFAMFGESLSKFCEFTGKHGYMGILEKGAYELSKELEELIFGPPPPNTIPFNSQGFAKGLPGDSNASVNGPSWITYPANATMYAAKSGLVLVNDTPQLPMLATGDFPYKNNAKALATILALESVQLALPPLRALTPDEIVEFREETKNDVKPFRLAMLKLSKELNSAITSDTPIEEIQQHAKFLAETTVYPALEELNAVAKSPTKGFWKRTVDFTKSIPELAGSYFTSSKLEFAQNTLGKLAGWLVDYHGAREDKESGLKRGGFHYLLQIQNKQKK